MTCISYLVEVPYRGTVHYLDRLLMHRLREGPHRMIKVPLSIEITVIFINLNKTIRYSYQLVVFKA